MYHRLDGPAIEYISGAKLWYIQNKRLSREKENLLNIWYERQNK